MVRKRVRPASFKTIDHFQVVQNISVRGATEKDVLRDPDSGGIFIAKLGGRNNDIEVMTEYVIYLVGRSLGVPLATASIALYRGRLRFLSQYFLESNEELVHGLQLFNQLYDETTVQEVIRDELKEQALFSVQAIKAAFGAHYLQYGADVEDVLFSGLISMLTHDALIGVQDRHHENWGVVVRREVDAPSPRFAPLYDSARGLFCNATDDQLVERYRGRDGLQRLDGYVGRARPLVGFDGLMPSHGRAYITHEQLLAAVFEAYPAQRQRITNLLAAYNWESVSSDLAVLPGGLCCPFRRDLIRRCLRRRLRSINRAIHG